MKKELKNILQKILVIAMMIVQLTILLGIKAEATTLTAVQPIALNFTPKQVIINPNEPILYAIDAANKKVFSINYNTRTTSFAQFNLEPERLYFANNKLYVALLKSGHQYYGGVEEGAVAILDPSTLGLKSQFNVDIDPFDMVVTNNGLICISSGSNQWTSVSIYSELLKTKSSSSGIYHRSYVALHPNMSKIYTVTSELSPSDIGALTISQSKFVESYDSPYHGDYPIGSVIKVSPDGKYLFNSAGTVFSSTSAIASDMNYMYSLEQGFTDMTFNITDKKFYIAIGKTINAYDYETFQLIGSYVSTGTVKNLFYQENKIITVAHSEEKSCFIEVIDKNIMKPVNSSTHGIKIPGNIEDCVYDAKNNKAYAVEKTFNKLYTINLLNNKIEKSMTLPYRPSALCLSEDGNKIYIANNDAGCLVTELNITTSAVRNINYSVELNVREFAHKHIYNRGNKLYVVTGEWSPRLLIFDAVTLAEIDYSPKIDEVGGLAFSKDNKYMYTWIQYGWDAGSVNSGIKKYEIGSTNFTEVDSYLPYYTELHRDPLDTPIILLEDEELIIFKNKVLKMNNLNENYDTFSESIYAINPTRTIAASNTGIYLLNYDLFGQFNFATAPKVLFFNNYGALYIQHNNTIYPLIPLPGDTNGDTEFSNKDYLEVLESFNAREEDSTYNFVRDINGDKIIDIYDLVLVSTQLSDSDIINTKNTPVLNYKNTEWKN